MAVLESLDEASYHRALDEPELVYMLGYCQVQNLEHAEAEATLRDFLEDFPDASPRLVVTARQMLAELARRIPERMGEIADLMGWTEAKTRNLLYRGLADLRERLAAEGVGWDTTEETAW